MRRRTRLLPRTTYVRDAHLCVIAVEGEREEKWYFEGLRDHGWIDTRRVRVEVLPAVNGESSPKHVVARLEAFESQNGDLISHDQRWLVMDVDRHKDLHDALTEAREHRWNVAVSNPCFEVWLQLHWRETPEGCTSKHATTSWRRLRAERSEPWPFTLGEVEHAIERASGFGDHHDHIPMPPPATGVYRLVEALRSATA